MSQQYDWKADFESLLLKGTEYSGSGEAKKKSISASSIGREPYFLMLQYLYGKTEEQTEYGANTTGSIYQLGLDALIAKQDTEGRYITAKRIKHELDNGWTVSGEFDILDTFAHVIIDAKVLSGASFKEYATKDDIKADYNLQLSVYNYLIWKTEGTKQTAALHMVNKGGAKARNDIMLNKDIDILEPEEVEQLIVDITNRLNLHIENDTMPSEICDIWKFGKTNGVANRCKLYCDYNKVCPHYTGMSHVTTKSFINSLEPDVSKDKPVYNPSANYTF
jgi:hypothetical protein